MVFLIVCLTVIVICALPIVGPALWRWWDRRDMERRDAERRAREEAEREERERDEEEARRDWR